MLLNDPTYVEAARALRRRVADATAARPTPSGWTSPSAGRSAATPRPDEVERAARPCWTSTAQEFAADKPPRPRSCSTVGDCAAPPATRPRRTGRLDERLPRAAEPARDDHAELRSRQCNPIDQISRRDPDPLTPAAPSSAAPPAASGCGSAGVAARMRAARSARRRRRRPTPSAAASSTRCTSPPKAKRVICLTWPAGRRTWRRSTTSRSWPRCTASRCPSRSPRASRSPSCRAQKLNCFGPQHHVQEVRQVGPGDLRALPAHRRRSPTTSASSARCRPRRSTTTRPTRS